MDLIFSLFQTWIVLYGNTGCGVFKRGVQNLKGFCLRINILKGNYWVLRIGLVGASEVFKNQSFKSQLFSSSQKKNTSNWNHSLILMLLLIFIKKIKHLRQFLEKNLNKWAWNHLKTPQPLSPYYWSKLYFDLDANTETQILNGL